MRIAFLGLGRMGAAMARHALTAGHELVVWNRTPGRADDLVAAGATEAASVEDAVREADVVALMLFGPESVRGVLEQLVEEAPRGALVVDATTIGPEAAREFEATANGAGLRYADAPVAGSVQPATDGTLGVLVGCHEQDWDQVRAVVELWGDPARVRRVGDVGAGSALKLCFNQSIGVLAAGLGESLALGRALGLDRSVVLDVLAGSGYGWLLDQKRAAVESGEHDDVSFSLELLAKDLDLAAAAGGDLPMAVTRAALDDARRALEAGHDGADYAAVVSHLADEEPVLEAEDQPGH